MEAFCVTTLLRPAAALCFIAMLLIAAAMEEELETGLKLCSGKEKIPHRSVSLWQARRKDKTIGFLKAGVGPTRSAANLEEVLNIIEVSQILIIGYAGALDPGLKLGDLVSVRRALAFSLDKDNPTWENVQLDGTFDLTQSEELAQFAKTLSLSAYFGDALTSRHVLGDPVHKNFLYTRFGASIVDMETAALARVAASKNVPLSCIRAISDEAGDTFLEPFSYDPSKNLAVRAGKFFSHGMAQTYREWKSHSLVANRSLSQFLSHYL